MYVDHWHLREKPFENTADPRFLFPSVAHEEALNRLLDAYNYWRAHPTEENCQRFQEECACYQKVDPNFDPERFGS